MSAAEVTTPATSKAANNAGQNTGAVPGFRGHPSPADAGGRKLWFSCVIGEFILPPDNNSRFPTGEVIVEADSTAKKDKKQAAGKDKSKTTKQGKEDTKIKIHCTFTTKCWADGEWGKGWESVLAELDPNFPDGGGGPYAFSHPDTNRRDVKSVMVNKIGKLVWKGHIGKVEIDCTEWTAPSKPAGGATSTPTKVDGSKWSAKANPGDVKLPKGDPLEPVKTGAAPVPAKQ